MHTFMANALRLIPALLLVLLTCAPSGAAEYKDIVRDWTSVQPPEAPAVQAVSVAHATTALLILDIEELTCNAERRPRCLETVPRIADLMRRAREAHMPVLYSITPKGTRETILPAVAPRHGDPVVQASVDKFLNTPLETLLEDLHVSTVIVTGTAAHGAVLNTATGAAQRGLQVILPVDGLSAESLFIEQAAVWLLHTGPATAKRVTLTRTADIAVQ